MILLTPIVSFFIEHLGRHPEAPDGYFTQNGLDDQHTAAPQLKVFVYPFTGKIDSAGFVLGESISAEEE